MTSLLKSDIKKYNEEKKKINDDSNFKIDNYINKEYCSDIDFEHYKTKINNINKMIDTLKKHINDIESGNDVIKALTAIITNKKGLIATLRR